MRRKNLRNPVTNGAIDSDIATVADNFWGVDLNRNSAQGFGQQNRSSASVTSLVYRGTAPASKPEHAALLEAARLGPTARLRLFSDTHSFGQDYFAPQPANARLNAIARQLAQRMIAASGRAYVHGPDPAGTPGIGTTADHFAFEAAIAAEIRERPGNGVVYRAHWNASGSNARALTIEVNEALVPGGSYRLWVAFNKPMRIRNSSGDVVAYAGQGPDAPVGTVTLEVPSLTGADVSLGAAGAWLAAPGGAPDGYLRYSDDAFAVDFTLPTTIDVAAATPAVLSLDTQDLAQMALDGDPGSAVDWGGGAWTGYENAAGMAGDSGGADCSFKPFIAAAAGAAPPAGETQCAAAEPPPPPLPPPPPPADRGGGGGGWGALFLLLGLCVLRGISPKA